MNLKRRTGQSGSALLCALCTITVLSIIAAGVLMNCTTRYNASSKQIKAWKEALYAAEGGADAAFNEIRKYNTSSSTGFPAANGWSSPAPSPVPTPMVSPSPTPASWACGYASPYPQAFGVNNSLNYQVTVDKIDQNGQMPVYRIRSAGTAVLQGFKRVGMDDRLDGITKGDSLLRRIDFNYDHFKAAFGYGDALSTAASTSGNGKGLQSVSNAKITRRVELIVAPITPIDAAIKAASAFSGPGSAGVVDSYDSKNGAYMGSNPASPYDADAHDGNVSVGTSSFSQGGYIYGDVTTNGGSASTSNISGVVDNNVAFTIPPQTLPSHPGYQSAASSTFTPVANTATSFDDATCPWYNFGSFSNGNISNPSGTSEVYVNVVVTGDISASLTVAQGVNVRFFLSGNFSMKGKDFANNNVDGSPSSNPSRAGHIQLYGINPTAPATQTIQMSPPGNFYMLIYAPGADVTMNGNPDLFGACVCKSWSGNGNTGFHFDKQLSDVVKPTDYRVASYVEDIR